MGIQLLRCGVGYRLSQGLTLSAWAIHALASSDAAFAPMFPRCSRMGTDRARRHIEQCGLVEIAPRLRGRLATRRDTATAASLLAVRAHSQANDTRGVSRKSVPARMYP
jgi:hypothetical protein